MTLHKITSGDGYTYLTRQVARGDSEPERGQAIAAYYAATGNPPGRWMGRGLAALGVAGAVGEEQMKALFGCGMHPDAAAIMNGYRVAHVRAGMSGGQLAAVNERAAAAARLGRRFPEYKGLEAFDRRVAARLAVIEQEAGRPATEVELKRVRREEARRQRRAVAGFDAVFTPVKSVSLLWALDERTWVREAIGAAHGAARDRALRLLEEHAAFTRSGSSGQAQIDTRGLVMAAFDHADNRLGEPNLHTHVAISSKVQGSDGRWRALDARNLYRIAVAASELYNTVLENELHRRLGVEFVARSDTAGQRNPVREIRGVGEDLIAFLAARRAEIEARYEHLVAAFRARHGREPSPSVCHELAQQATLDTRTGKKAPRSWRDQRAQWREQVIEKFGRSALRDLADVVPGQAMVRAAGDDLVVPKVAAEVIAAVSGQRSTWTRWNVLAQAERQLRAERFSDQAAHDEAVNAVVDVALGGHSLLIAVPEQVAEPQVLCRADGCSVFVEHGVDRYTSTAILEAEARLLQAARTPTAVGVAGPILAAALAAYEQQHHRILDPGQRALITSFAADGRLLVAGIGPAGSGKTTAMRALRHAVEADGGRLVPLATSAAAAAVLDDELNVPAENVHKFLWEWTRGPHADALHAGGRVPPQASRFELRAGDVLLVDEAGMAGTLNLDRLVTIAAGKGAVVRLLGDYRQLGAVESGGALRLVATEVGAVEMQQLHRFDNHDEAEATLRTRVGDTRGLDFYAQRGRIHHGSRQAMTEAVYAGWRTDMLAGLTTLMAAATNADIARLAARARAERVAAGQVERKGTRLHDGNLAGVGDWIITRTNDRRLGACGGRDWVKNGDGWRVLHRHRDGRLLVEHLNHLGRITLPARYVAGSVELLYATTTHRAQGGTVDTAHPLITDGMSRENFYVITTRARQRTTLYVATHEHASTDTDEHVDATRFDADAYAAREILEHILNREGAEPSAHEALRTAHENAESLASLIPRYTHAVEAATRQHQQQTITGALPEHANRLADDPALPTLFRSLARAQDAGHEPVTLLRNLAHTRETDTADSLAQVLTWRINTHLGNQPAPSPQATPTTADANRYLAILATIAPAMTRHLTAETATTTPEPAHTAPVRYDRILPAALGSIRYNQARIEPSWPALCTALARAENAGWNLTNLLNQAINRRDLRTTRNITQTVALAINTLLLTQPIPPDQDSWRALARSLKAAEEHGAHAETLLHRAHTQQTSDTPNQAGDLATLTHATQQLVQQHCDTARDHTALPPWIVHHSGQRLTAEPGLRDYLNTRANLIRDRITTLTRQITDDPPDWSTSLGAMPEHPEAAARWKQAAAIVAAYRDHQQVTDDDQTHPLGPYIENGRAAHNAYWHAVTALFTARSAAGLRTPTTATGLADLAREQTAADLFASLPETDQHSIARQLADQLADNWHGDATQPEQDADQPVYRSALARVLAEHGLLVTQPTAEPAATTGRDRRTTSSRKAPRSPAGIPATPSNATVTAKTATEEIQPPATPPRPSPPRPSP